MSHWSLSELLPHAGDMILIDAIEACDDQSIRARMKVTPGGLFNLADGSLPAWVGIELMAQTVAAFAGIQAKRNGQPVELGFLLGTRKYESTVASLAANQQVEIKATCSLQDETGMGVFECTLTADPDVQMSARLNVYRPPNVSSYFEEPTP